MTITKYETKILKYIYRKKSVSYDRLAKKFSKRSDLVSTIEALVFNRYLIQIGGSMNKYGDPIPICDSTLFKITNLSAALVESKQWFDLEYIISHMVIPVVIAIVTTLITIFLTMQL